MLRALELAQLGRGHVSPNPMVGCVIVHEGKVIGEGYHQKYGEAHAEVNAVDAVKDKSLLTESTVYVTLEPCSHHGRTPPCADMLARHNVKKVVIGALDSNPLVAGKGISKLEQAGVEVQAGVLAEACRSINVRFFKSIEEHRPYVILKWAQTADGFVARKNFDSKWISNEQSRKLVHQWRADEDAILVGPNTAKYDNPRLNVRGLEGKDPIRVLIDRHLSVSNDLNLFDGSQPTIIYNLQKNEERDGVTYVKLDSANFLDELLSDLSKRKIQSIIIEGGAAILNAFIENDLWDEARVFTSERAFDEGIKAPAIQGSASSRSHLGKDKLEVFYSEQ